MALPKRKHPRLKEYDYSQNGYYYITIQTHNDLPVLSSVGRGLAPAADVFESGDDIEIILTTIGNVCEEQLRELKNRYNCVKIDKYVIMPTHIHAIIEIISKTAGASPRPTLTDIVCAYKSLTTRICNQNDNTPGRKIFQNSFYEKIIRDEQGYFEVWQYIDENPIKWVNNDFRC